MWYLDVSWMAICLELWLPLLTHSLGNTLSLWPGLSKPDPTDVELSSHIYWASMSHTKGIIYIHKISYCKILWSLEITGQVLSLWNFTGMSAAGIPRSLANFTPIGKLSTSFPLSSHSVGEKCWTRQTFLTTRPKCLIRDFTNLNRI